MANTGRHFLLGAGLTTGVYLLYKLIKKEPVTFGGVVKSVAVGGTAGILPDLIEPATNPNHRQFFHSLVFLGLTIYGNKLVRQDKNITPELKELFSLASAGMGSHLLADSLTPKGLPLI
ncbi:MAG: metal-dependent hydrolase [Planctomycetota bacterium]